MVEGPGCKVKGEIMRKRIKGKCISNIKLSAIEAGRLNSSRFLELHGLQISDVRTLGKELFIFVSQTLVCIRIHFLMDGSVRYGDSKERSTQSLEPCLTIFFSDDKLSVFKSSVDLRCAEESSLHCDDLADLDICSSVFNFKRAQEKIERKPSELICNVIMDQTVLPGVGNIIKNEALFKSGINPNTLVEDLSANLITSLLHRLKDFSAVFYMCRKTNKPLKNHLCIYEKSKCSQCGNLITVCKPGNLKRLTFFCSSCQINSNSSSSLSLPKKNSLLGFLQSSGTSKPAEDWECMQCTFINNFPSLSCSMCFTPIPNERKRKLSDEQSQSEASVLKRGKVEPAPDMKKKNDPPSIPECSGHGKKCSVRSVRNSEANKGRLFYSCSVRGNSQCKFFQWADLHHPLCKHEKRTILRRVLKQNDNNGKEFFCCPLPKNEQCDFFQWAK